MTQVFDFIIAGSGPGGGVTAHELAKAGKSVLLLEEGRAIEPNEEESFSVKDMALKYRQSGLTVALGNPKVSYVEGCVVGGGSEVNSGLYHRTPPAVLEEWRARFDVKAMSQDDMDPLFAYCEEMVSVSDMASPVPEASLRLDRGAQRLGWHSIAVPRWFSTDPQGTTRRHSISRTFIAKALWHGAALKPETRVTSFDRHSEGWCVKSRSGRAVAEYVGRNLVLACGAVGTPALLRRHGITHNVGNSLQLHPSIKVVARFREPVNTETMGVPIHQVKEFSPEITLGCSISSKSYLAMGLLENEATFHGDMAQWENLAVYYASIKAGAMGKVRTLPGLSAPIVRYQLDRNDIERIHDGLDKLSSALFEAGATHLVPSIAGGSPYGPGRAPKSDRGRLQLMTIHLFASCPMGENREKCAVDSFGKVFGQRNLYVNDASMLCSSLGVNPQGTIMAIAARNARAWLS